MTILGALSTLGALAVFSGLSLNLLLQFGLGIREIIEPFDSESTAKFPTQWQWASLSSPLWVILFASSLILWLFFTYVLPPPAFGFLESFLLFPAAILVSMALESLFVWFFPDGKITRAPDLKRGPFDPWKIAEGAGFSPASSGLAPASLFLTLRLAVSLADALVLSLGFALGCLVSALILREINKRSSLEAVPRAFRGIPLTLISMGLLSLIFSSVSAIFLRTLGFF
jgi:electron transport complex protein RnfA